MKKNYRIAHKGSDRYVVGEITPYNQKNEMFKRVLWDPKLLELGKKFYHAPVNPTDIAGYRLEDFSLVNASWILEDNQGMNDIIEALGGINYKRYRIYSKSLV